MPVSGHQACAPLRGGAWLGNYAGHSLTASRQATTVPPPSVRSHLRERREAQQVSSRSGGGRVGESHARSAGRIAVDSHSTGSRPIRQGMPLTATKALVASFDVLPAIGSTMSKAPAAIAMADSRDYALAISELERLGCSADAATLFSHMCSAGVVADGIALNAGLATFRAASDWVRALRLLRDTRLQFVVHGTGAEPDARSFSTVLGACADVANWNCVLALFEEMQRHGFQPDAGAHSSAIDACRALQRFGEASRLLRDLSKSKAEGSEVAGVAALARQRMWVHALLRFDALRRAACASTAT